MGQTEQRTSKPRFNRDSLHEKPNFLSDQRFLDEIVDIRADEWVRYELTLREYIKDLFGGENIESIDMTIDDVIDWIIREYAYKLGYTWNYEQTFRENLGCLLQILIDDEDKRSVVMERFEEILGSKNGEQAAKMMLATILILRMLANTHTADTQREFYAERIAGLIEAKNGNIDALTSRMALEAILLLAPTLRIEGLEHRGLEYIYGVKKGAMTEIYAPVVSFTIASREGIKYVVEVYQTPNGLTITYRNYPCHLMAMMMASIKDGSKNENYVLYLPVAVVGDLAYFIGSQDKRTYTALMILGDGTIIGAQSLLPEIDGEGYVEVYQRDGEIRISIRGEKFEEYYRQDISVGDVDAEDVRVLRELGWLRDDVGLSDSEIARMINERRLSTRERAALGSLLIFAHQIRVLAEEMGISIRDAYRKIEEAYEKAFEGFSDSLLEAYVSMADYEGLKDGISEWFQENGDELENVLNELSNPESGSQNQRIRELASTAKEYLKNIDLSKNPREAIKNLSNLLVTLRKISSNIRRNTENMAEKKFLGIYKKTLGLIDEIMKHTPTRFELLSNPVGGDKELFLSSSRALAHILHLQLDAVYAAIEGIYVWRDGKARRNQANILRVLNSLPRPMRYILALKALEYLEHQGTISSRQAEEIKKTLSDVYQGRRKLELHRVTKENKYLAELVAFIDASIIPKNQHGMLDMSRYAQPIRQYIGAILSSHVFRPELNEENLAVWAMFMYASSKQTCESPSVEDALMAEFLAIYVDTVLGYTEKIEGHEEPLEILDSINGIKDIEETINIMNAWAENNYGDPTARTLHYKVGELKARISILKKMLGNRIGEVLSRVKNEMKAVGEKAENLSIREINQQLQNAYYRFVEEGGETTLRPTTQNIFLVTDIVRIMSLNYEVVRKAGGLPVGFQIGWRLNSRGELESCYASIYDMLLARGGLADEKTVRDFVKNALKLDPQEFNKKLRKLVETVRDNLGIEDAALIKVLENMLKMYARKAREWNKQGLNPDKIVEKIYGKMKMLDALLRKHDRENLIMELAKPTSKEKFEEAKRTLAAMLIGDPREAEKILATQTQTTQQTSQNQQANTRREQNTERQVVENMKKQSMRTLIRQKFEKTFRKIFSKAAAIGFIRELARQLLTGLFVAIFTIVGMKIAGFLIDALRSKEQPLMIIGYDEKNREIGRITWGTSEKGITTITLTTKENKKKTWRTKQGNSGEAMDEALGMLNSTGRLRSITITQNSPLALMPHFQTKTLIWLIVTFLVGIIFKVIITNKVLGAGKKLAVVIASSLGVWAYAKDHGVGLLDDMVMGITMMAWVWVWDEFDDFQDGIEALNGGEGGGEAVSFLGEIKHMLMDPELTIGAMLLGFFGQILGISDPMQLVIPGMLGFAQYVAEVLPPAPWGHILRIIYDILAFVLANVVASGAKGVGWVFYLAGSVLGNILMQNMINALEA